MSSNLPLVRQSRRVLPRSGGLKLEINIPSQRICAKWKGGLINEGGVISSEYGMWYILHSDWSLLLLVNKHGSFHCTQGVLLVLKLTYKIVYTVNKVA